MRLIIYTLQHVEGCILQPRGSTTFFPGADKRVGGTYIHQKVLFCLPSQFKGQS